MTRHFVLINTNVSRPPVSPVGLEYVGHSLLDAGIPLEVIDLAFEANWEGTLKEQFSKIDALAVGISVRNTDDSSFITRKSFLPWIAKVVKEVKESTSAPIIAGGLGFSIMPEGVLKTIDCDLGIQGDGEEVIPHLAQTLVNNEDFTSLPNVVYRLNRKTFCNPRSEVNTSRYPLPYRNLFDNPKYEQFGAMVGVETKRGCPEKCIYCADPVAKGRKVRLRPPKIVTEELRNLAEQGVTWFHLCDSEFNLPLVHAKGVCKAIIDYSLQDRIRWYCYCSPAPFDQELAQLMRKAGCAGINFGVDSLCDHQLSRLGRRHRLDDIKELISILRQERFNFMFDLLLGAPGETKETITTTIGWVKRLDVPLAGIALGVRVYSGTPLGKMMSSGLLSNGIHPKGGHSLENPTFYLSPSLGAEPTQLVAEVVAGDPRFLFLSSPSQERSYNYADDETLCNLIKQGARGAYWDILQKQGSQRK